MRREAQQGRCMPHARVLTPALANATAVAAPAAVAALAAIGAAAV